MIPVFGIGEAIPVLIPKKFIFCNFENKYTPIVSEITSQI